MKKIILFSMLLVSLMGFSQEEGKIFEITTFDEQNKLPEYPDGGETGFRKFIAQNFRPNDTLQNDLKGRVIVSFVVEKDGSISNIKIRKDIGYGTGDEIIRIIKKSKKWKPAIQDGKPVRVSYTLPISINIQGNPAVIKSE